MPVAGLFNDDARNIGGRTRILKRQWQHEQRVAAAGPAIFVPTRRKQARARAKRDTVRRAYAPPTGVITRRSDAKRSDVVDPAARGRARGKSRRSPSHRRAPSDASTTHSSAGRGADDSDDGASVLLSESRRDAASVDSKPGEEKSAPESKRGDSGEEGGSSGIDHDGAGDGRGGGGADAIVAIVEDMHLQAHRRPRRPDHLMEISDWRGIRIDFSDSGGDDDSDSGDSADGTDSEPGGGGGDGGRRQRARDLIQIGSYVRLAPNIDTFGCLNFGDRGIVTRMVTSRNASVPHKPRRAQAYEVLGPRAPGMFWFERGEVEKCPQKLFSPREWSRRKHRHTRKARLARAAKARKEWLMEQRRQQQRRQRSQARRGGGGKSGGGAVPLTTDEDWREHGAHKLSTWKRRAGEEKAALAVVQHDMWPWVSHVHTERMIDMYDQTLRDRRKPLRRRNGLAVDPSQAGNRIDHAEASNRYGPVVRASPFERHSSHNGGSRLRTTTGEAMSPRRTQQLQVSRSARRESRRPRTAALLAGGFTDGVLDQFNRERSFIANSRRSPGRRSDYETESLASLADGRGSVPAAGDKCFDNDVMSPQMRLRVKTLAQGKVVDRRKYGKGGGGAPRDRALADQEFDLQVLKDDLRSQIIAQRIYKRADLEDFFELVARLEKWHESGVQRVMQELREEFYMTADDD